MDGKQCAGSVLGLANQIKRVFDTTTGRCGTNPEFCLGVISGQGDISEGHRRGTEHTERICFYAFKENGGTGFYPAGKGFL